MAIPVIFKGDTARPVTLTLAEGYDYGGCSLLAEFCGARRVFDGVKAGGKVEMAFTADETARFPLGTSSLFLSLVNGEGDVRSLPWAKVKVTDAPGEVYEAAVTVDPATLSVDDLTAADSLGEVKSRLNAVLAFLRGKSCAACLAACLAAFASLASLASLAQVVPLYSTPNEMPGDAQIMTNAAEYADAAISSALADKADASALEAHVADGNNPHGVTAAQVGALTKAQGDAAYYPKSDGDLWAAWWSGDGFRVTVTNYNVAPSADVAWSRLPSAKFEYRPDGDATNELRVVWDEETKWRRWRGEFAAATNDFRAALDGKAGLDWGATTPTGFDAPAGFTWLDTPATVIASGLAWQKTLTSEGAFWVLSSNGMVAQFGAPGASTNGYFRITDERGNAVFEIVAGDKVTVGANAASVHTWQHTDGRTRLRVVYNVDSAEAPKLYAVQSLNPGGTTDWKEVGTEGCAALAAGWTGQRGAWTNALWLANAPASASEDSLFVCATYERGGGTVVRNNAAVEMQQIVIGGKTYRIGTAQVGGHTVLTLTEAQ